MRRTTAALISTLFLALAVPAEEQVPQPDPEPDPVDSGLVEEVEVKLVLLDVLVLDGKDRTVASLGRDDFELTVDGRPVEIASVDLACPDGAAPDVKAVREAAEQPSPEASVPHRIVHAFDYDHMENVALALEQAREAVRRHSRAGDEQMLIAIGPTLRVEQDFTSDAATLDRALARMHDDPGLYGAHLGRLTDRRFYQRLQTLMDLLDRIDGPKVVVLYSGPFPADGFNHDVEFRRISALSARARVALYPVDTGGLRTPLGFVYGDLGGPKELARLAVESGGRVTYHTNDLGLALARAQRDLGCRYTLGFYDASPIRDRARSVRVWLPRSSMRAVHSAAYVIRSDERLLADRLRTARMVPELFDSGGMHVEARAVRPLENGRWEVLVSVELPEEARARTADEPWKLEGAVRSASGATRAKFRRELPADDGAGATAPDEPITELLDVAPGAYSLGVVLVREGLEEPFAAAVPLELPPTPQAEHETEVDTLP